MSQAKFLRDVRTHRDVLLTGTVLCIDPASGGTSQPGWSLWKAGTRFASGTLRIKKAAIGPRLVEVRQAVWANWAGLIDVLVIEELRGRMVHPHLWWAVGATIAGAEAPTLLEVPIRVWKQFAKADPKYAKDDEQDAIKLGEAILAVARHGVGALTTRGGVGGGLDPSTGARATGRRPRTNGRATARARGVGRPRDEGVGRTGTRVGRTKTTRK